MNIEPSDCEELREFPQHSVPDHQVLLSFNADSQAIKFSEWWNTKGFAVFAKWIAKERE